MFDEDQLLPISALQHLDFCPRQCALIHLDRLWAENRLTAEGRIMHDRVHDRGTKSRRDRIQARGLRIRSLCHGIFGVADAVDFVRSEEHNSETVHLSGTQGHWLPRPVEYKRGRPKHGRCDELQLCAQALCLEEMLGVPIASGDLYYGKTRRRNTVRFNDSLRKKTFESIAELRRLLGCTGLPAAECGPKCKRCSLREECFPTVVNPKCSARTYVAAVLWGAQRRCTRPGGACTRGGTWE